MKLRHLLTVLPALIVHVSAIATPVPDPSAPGSTQWDITNTGGTSGLAFSGSCDLSPGLTIFDATSGDGTADAFNNAWSVWVDNIVFNATPAIDLISNTVTAGPVTLSQLEVSMEYVFSDSIQAGRIRAMFENPTAGDITVTVDVPVNLGSNATTVIETTSSGDALFSTADRWVVTSENSGTAIPVNTTVFWGPAATDTPGAVTRTVFTCAGDTGEGLGATFNITIPANSTRALLFFAGLGDITGTGNTIAGAMTGAAMFDDNNTIDDSLLAGMSADELNEILNWAFQASGSGGGSSCSLRDASASPWQAGDLWLLFMFIAGSFVWRTRYRSSCP